MAIKMELSTSLLERALATVLRRPTLYSIEKEYPKSLLDQCC